MKFIFSIILLLLIFSCTNPTKTKEILRNEGYTSIKITGYAWFIADKNDMYSTGFEATNSNNKFVKGAVTGGFFKGYTIRLR